jgi:hypothetical protein
MIVNLINKKLNSNTLQYSNNQLHRRRKQTHKSRQHGLKIINTLNPED